MSDHSRFPARFLGLEQYLSLLSTHAIPFKFIRAIAGAENASSRTYSGVKCVPVRAPASDLRYFRRRRGRILIRVQMGTAEGAYGDRELIDGNCGAAQSRPSAPPAAAAALRRQHVIFLRHGERLDDVDRSWSSPRPWDPPLTAHGRDQAGEAGRRLRTLGLNITRVYCSPFLRYALCICCCLPP